MKERCPGSHKVGIGELVGYVLSFPRKSAKRSCGVASVEMKKAASVWGVLFEISDSDLKSLDRNEGYMPDREKSKNSYCREDIFVRLRDGTDRKCLTYFANPQEGEHKPNAEYKKLIVDGATENSLPEDYEPIHK